VECSTKRQSIRTPRFQNALVRPVCEHSFSEFTGLHGALRQEGPEENIDCLCGQSSTGKGQLSSGHPVSVAVFPPIALEGATRLFEDLSGATAITI